MPEKPASERTEQPTTRKLQKAKEKGHLPQSQELISIATLLVLVATITLLAPSLMQWFVMQVKEGVSCDNSVFADPKVFWTFISDKTIDMIIITCPILGTLFVGSVLAGLAVSGLSFSPEAINFKFNQLNPVEGISKLVNMRSLVKLLISILKLIFVSAIVWSYLHNKLEALAALRWVWSAQMLAVIAKMVLGLMIRVCIALFVIAAIDVIYQKWKYTSDLKMTRQEVKQERKDTEVSPEVRSRVRRAQIEMSMRRITEEVPKASVVLVNPTHVAVAIRYDSKTMEAPVVVAKGADHLAEKIREVAQAYGVPIIRRPELARAIYSSVKPGNPIPETLYVAVAEVLAMIYRLRRKK